MAKRAGRQGLVETQNRPDVRRDGFWLITELGLSPRLLRQSEKI